LIRSLTIVKHHTEEDDETVDKNFKPRTTPPSSEDDISDVDEVVQLAKRKGKAVSLDVLV
jgi:hypothetical protein